MKKIIISVSVTAILSLLSLALFSQPIIKFKDQPTTTTGSTADYLLKDDAAGIPGSTHKITVANFFNTYHINTYTATPLFQGANTYTGNTSINNTGTFLLHPTSNYTCFVGGTQTDTTTGTRSIKATATSFYCPTSFRSQNTVFGAPSSITGMYGMYNSSNTNEVFIKSGITSSTYTWTLPVAQGNANTFLKNDGSGNLIWTTSLNKVDTIYRTAGKDSIVYKINGIRYAIKDSVGGDSGWSLTGNAGTTAGTNYQGTSDSVDAVYKTNGSERMRILAKGGKVGINTPSPNSRLQITGGKENLFEVNSTVNYGLPLGKCFSVNRYGMVEIGNVSGIYDCMLEVQRYRTLSDSAQNPLGQYMFAFKDTPSIAEPNGVVLFRQKRMGSTEVVTGNGKSNWAFSPFQNSPSGNMTIKMQPFSNNSTDYMFWAQDSFGNPSFAINNKGCVGIGHDPSNAFPFTVYGRGDGNTDLALYVLNHSGTGLLTLGGDGSCNLNVAGYPTRNLTVARSIMSNTSDIIVESNTRGLILKDTASPAHYWRIQVSVGGVLGTTDLGTSLPAE